MESHWPAKCAGAARLPASDDEECHRPELDPCQWTKELPNNHTNYGIHLATTGWNVQALMPHEAKELLECFVISIARARLHC